MAEDDILPPPDLPQPVLPPGAGLGTFMGGRPSDFLGMLGAFLGPLARGPVSRSIGPVINVLAQGWGNNDQQARIQQLGQDLDTQYGGLDLPELQMARILINQGDVPGGMQMLTQGISNRNRQQRADRLAQQQGTAAIARVNTLQPITEPGITSLEPLTQAQRLAPPTGSSPRNWQNVDRAPTMPEIMARLEEIANPTVRGLAAKSFETSWREHAEETPGSEADPYITYPVYDHGVWRQTRTLRSGGQTSASR